MNPPTAAKERPQAAQQALQEALALHRQGKRDLAMQRYVAILQDDPENIDALYYVAVLALQEGQIAEGIKVIERALTVGPPQGRLFNLLGQAHLRLNQDDAALESFDRAIACEPGFADAYGNRANVLADMGRLGEAVVAFDRALALRPNNAEDICNRASVLADLGRLEEALAGYERAIALLPDLVQAHYNRADILRRLGRLPEALASYDRAIALSPRMAAAHSNRSVVLKELGRLDEAKASVEQALALEPDFPDALVNRGNIFRELGKLDEAGRDYQRALAINPKFAAAQLGQAHTLLELGQTQAAQAMIERAIALEPDDNKFMSLSFCQLLTGDWRNGWESYEHRYNPQIRGFTPLPYPLWNGEPLPDERLVLVTEQGLGDAIQFVRFATVLALHGFAVTLRCSATLAPLLSTVPGIEGVVTTDAALTSDPRPIRWLPLMSIGRILGITPDNVPHDIPYLFAEPHRVAAWADRLGPGFKVGLAWRGTHRKRLAAARSIPLAAMAPLAALRGVRLISLQKSPGNEQIDTVDFGRQIERPADEYELSAESLLDTAALIMNLDLVVTCDTSVAHLAGALGRPVFVALPFFSEWRWLQNRSDSPFYPTMRLFRQSRAEQWDDVFAQITAAVEALLNS